MSDVLLPLLSALLLVVGGFFLVVGAVGVLRFPNFFTRIHAAGVCETLGSFATLLGLMALGGGWLVTVKLALILVFLALTNPVSSHALTRAALHDGVLHRHFGKDPSWKP
jgi:multicomponent Na+:H+ antiporter subunit G